MSTNTKAHSVKGPQDHPQVYDSLGGLTAQQIIMLMAKIYYSERIQRKISKGKGQKKKGGQSPDEIRHRLP